MKAFILKIILFCLPFMFIFGFSLVTLFTSGELTSYNAVAARRLPGSPPILVGLAYSNPEDYLSFRATLTEKPQVLVLGSSRVEEIRSDFFAHPADVYVASGVTQTMAHANQFLDAIPADGSPKLLIVGLDQKFFDPNYDVTKFGFPENITPWITEPPHTIDILANWLANWSDIYRYIFTGEYTFADFAAAHHSLIGLSAVTLGDGFRNDGSYDPAATMNYTPTSQEAIRSDIVEDKDGFEYSSSTSPLALAELDSFLSKCRARGIYVIGFMPPLAPSIYHAMQSMPDDDYSYLNLLSPQVGMVFNKYKFGFYNFSDPDPLGIIDAEIPDGIHTTETATRIIFEKMVETNPVLRQYADSTVAEIKTGSK